MVKKGGREKRRGGGEGEKRDTDNAQKRKSSGLSNGIGSAVVIFLLYKDDLYVQTP